MAFRGVQGGGFDPMTAVQLALAIRQQNAQERQQQEKTRIDKMNAIAKLRKSQLDEQKTMLEIAKNQGDLQNQRTEQDSSLGEPLSIASDTSAPPSDRQVAANQFVRGVNQQIAQRSPTGNIFDAPAGVAETVGGRAGSAAARTRREQRQTIEETIREDIGEARGSIAAGEELIRNQGAVKREIARKQALGLDPSVEREKLQLIRDLRRQQASKGQVKVINPPSPTLINQERQKIASAENALSVVERLVNDLNEGNIRAGVGGTIQGFAEGTRDVLGELAQSIEILGPNAGSLREAVRSAQVTTGPVTFVDSNGRQRTLGMDAMTLAFEFIRANKGDGRITTFEFEQALDNLAPTGVFRSEKEFRAALRRVAGVSLRRARASQAFLKQAAPEFAVDIDTSMPPEDKAFLDRISRPPSGNRGSKVRAGDAGTAPQPEGQRGRPKITVDSLPENPTRAQEIEAFESEIERFLSGQGALNGGAR